MRNKPTDKESGPGTFRWAYGNLMEEIVAASKGPDNIFHSLMEMLISLCWPHIVHHKEDWDKEMTRVLVGPDGQPLPVGAHVTKAMRHQQIRCIQTYLYSDGILSFQRQGADDGRDFFGEEEAIA